MNKALTGTIVAFLLTTAGGLAETNQAATVCAGHLAVCPKCGFVETNQGAVDRTAVTNDWKSSVYGGFAAQSGNTDAKSYKYGGEFDKTSDKIYRYKLKADGKYSKTAEQVTDSKAEASGEMRRMFNERWFAYGTLSALHDDLKRLSYRVKTGPGLGYYFVESKALTADVSSGPLYVREKTADNESGYLAWRVAQWFDWQLTDTFRWWISTEAFMDTTDTSAYTLTFKTGIETKINSRLSLLVFVEDDYDSKPEESGDVKKNDSEISTGVRYTF